jgi:hypothetical protein
MVADPLAVGNPGGIRVGVCPLLRIGEGAPQRAALTDLAVDLAARAAGFRRSLPDGLRGALADLGACNPVIYLNPKGLPETSRDASRYAVIQAAPSSTGLRCLLFRFVRSGGAAAESYVANSSGSKRSYSRLTTA